jgi:hypothetical protein
LRAAEGKRIEGEKPMADHKHGSMDIAEQEKTFAGFVRVAGVTIVVVAAILVLLTFRI